MRTSEVLNRAADMIEQYGWTTISDVDPIDGNPWGGNGQPMCLEGGILAAMGLEPNPRGLLGSVEGELLSCPAYKAMQEYLGEERLYRYNDAEGRTKQEVIEVLRAAAVVEQAKENAKELVK